MLVHEYFPNMASVPGDGDKARDTRTYVAPDAPASVADDAPDFNEANRDGITEGGLTTSQVASAVTPSGMFPILPPSTVPDAIQSRINDRQATSGLAASREAAGEWGHGSMKIVQGIEPGITAEPFDNRYFAALPHAVDSADYMTAVNTDPSAAAVAGAIAVENTRDARDLYGAFLGLS